MSSPGGTTEVGRVSIRVLPDTGGFRQRLVAAVNAAERDLEVTVPVNFEVDTAGLRTQIEALDKSKVTIPVNFDPDLAGFRARLAALEKTKITIPVDLNLQDSIAAIQAQVEALDDKRLQIKVSVTGATAGIRRLTALAALVEQLDGRNININVDVDAAAAVAQVAALEAALSGVRASLGSINTGGGGGFNGMRGGALRAAGALALIPPIAAAISVAGAGITAVYGAAATAIAAIPAALFTIAGPIAAITTGLDGIKAAAKTIKPEFDAMQKAVSTTFEQRMIPVFDKLADTFPRLTNGMQGTAVSLSDISMRLAEMLASEPGLDRIDLVFANINKTLGDMSPGIAAAVDGLLIMGSQSGAFDVLSSAVNTFGTAFRQSVLETIDDGTLAGAMNGLETMLDNLALAFVGAVENGIEVFAAAAPGVNDALEAIGGFFDRFDWTSLGTSVGGVFSGIADGINSIPSGTIDAIEREFAELSAVFQSGEMQAGIQAIADALPGAISLLGDMTRDSATLAQEIGPLVTELSELSTGLSNFSTHVEESGQRLNRDLTNPTGGLSPIGKWIADQLGIVDEGTATVPPAIDNLGKETAAAAGSSFAAVPHSVAGQMEAVPLAATQPLEQVPPMVDSALGPVPAHVAAALANMSPEVASALVSVTDAFEAGLTEMPAIVDAAFTDLSGPISAGMTSVAQGVTDGMIGVEGAMEAGLVNVGSAVTAGFEAMPPAVTTGMAGLNEAVDIGFQSMLDGVGKQMIQFGTVVSDAFLGIQPQVTTGMSQLNTAVDIGFQSMLDGVGKRMIDFGTTVSNAFLTIQPAVTTGMSQLNTAVDIGFQSMTDGVGKRMIALGTVITTGMTGWAAQFSLGMSTLTNTLVLGFDTMAVSAAAGMERVTTAITTGFTTMGTAATTAMTNLNNQVVAGFNEMAGLVEAGMARVANTFTSGWTNIGTGVTTAMTDATTAVTNGMTDMETAVANGMTGMETSIQNGMRSAQTAVTTGVAAMVSVLNNSVGRFRAAGANMGAALAAGLRSMLGAVRAAADALAREAARAVAARAMINSPSKVFIAFGEGMGEGLVVGMNRSETDVERAARSMVDTVTASASQITDAFAIDPWVSDFDARVNAEFDALASVGATPTGKQTVINNNYYTESSERESAQIARVQRRQAAMGLFG
ncbi:MAG TPA: hypothetical protein VD834_16620 [Blastococcus sp.]|nr:hypothetical protein [Blastococcus sp.]